MKRLTKRMWVCLCLAAAVSAGMGIWTWERSYTKYAATMLAERPVEIVCNFKPVWLEYLKSTASQPAASSRPAVSADDLVLTIRDPKEIEAFCQAILRTDSSFDDARVGGQLPEAVWVRMRFADGRKSRLSVYPRNIGEWLIQWISNCEPYWRVSLCPSALKQAWERLEIPSKGAVGYYSAGGEPRPGYTAMRGALGLCDEAWAAWLAAAMAMMAFRVGALQPKWSRMALCGFAFLLMVMVVCCPPAVIVVVPMLVAMFRSPGIATVTTMMFTGIGVMIVLAFWIGPTEGLWLLPGACVVNAILGQVASGGWAVRRRSAEVGEECVDGGCEKEGMVRQ